MGRFGKFVDIRLALGEASQHRPPGRVGQRGECLAEPVLVDRRCHEFGLLLFHLVN